MLKKTKRPNDLRGGRKQQRWGTVRHDTKPVVTLPPTNQKAPLTKEYLDLANRNLMNCHQRYDAGDKYAVLDALQIICQLFAAQWLHDLWFNAVETHRACKVETLDEALGLPPRGKRRFDADQERARVRNAVLFRVYALHREGAPLDNDLLEQVGNEFDVGATYVREIMKESEEIREMLRRTDWRPAEK